MLSKKKVKANDPNMLPYLGHYKVLNNLYIISIQFISVYLKIMYGKNHKMSNDTATN